VRECLGEAVRMIGAWDDFEVLAHIDFPVRTWPGRAARYQTIDFEAEYHAVLGHWRPAAGCEITGKPIL
jgi:histidinol-phosphatase (PHP family)